MTKLLEARVGQKGDPIPGKSATGPFPFGRPGKPSLVLVLTSRCHQNPPDASPNCICRATALPEHHKNSVRVRYAHSPLAHPAVKPEAERRRLEEMREREFLREQGVKEEDLPALTSQAVRTSVFVPSTHLVTALGQCNTSCIRAQLNLHTV
jgi:hypothetical protein